MLCIGLVDGVARCAHCGRRRPCRGEGTGHVAGHLGRRGCGRSGGKAARGRSIVMAFVLPFVRRAAAAAVVIPPRRQLSFAARCARARRAAAAAAAAIGCGARPAPQHLRRGRYGGPSPSPSPSPSRRRLRRRHRHRCRRRRRRRRLDAPAAPPPPSAAAASLQPLVPRLRPLLRARGGLYLPGEHPRVGGWMEHGVDKEAAAAVTGQRGTAPPTSASTKHGSPLERRRRTGRRGRCGRCGGAAAALRRRARPRLLQPRDQQGLCAALVQPPRLAPSAQLGDLETLE